MIAWTLSSVGKDLTCGWTLPSASFDPRKGHSGKHKEHAGISTDYAWQRASRLLREGCALFTVTRAFSPPFEKSILSNTYYILIMSSLLTKATKHLPMYFYTLIYFVNIIHYVTIYCYTMSKSTQIHIISHHYHFYYMNFDITSCKLYVSLTSAVSSWCSIIHFSSNSSSNFLAFFFLPVKHVAM